MMDLIGYLVKDFASTELNKAKSYAEDEAKKLGDMLKSSIEEGIHNAVTNTMPLIMKTGFYLVGGAFFLYGLAKFIDTYVELFTAFEGVGFMVVGVVGLITALLIGSRK